MSIHASIGLHLAGAPRLVDAQGQVLKAGTRKALALAVLLALEGAITRERLLALLWAGAEPAAARRNLRRDVFRLRELGLTLADAGSDALSLDPPALHWPAPTGTPVVWLEGLDGVAGAELDEWLVWQREALQWRWVDALAARAAALEQQGQERAALQLWRQMLGQDCAGPDHEGARRAALRLHQWLGEHDAAWALSRESAPPPAPREAPAHRPAAGPLPALLPFTGREPELRAIHDHLARGRIVFIDGAPGSGKTRLALQAAAARGGVLTAGCRPEDAAVPFSSALRILDTLREAGDEQAVPAWARRELAALVPDWAAGTSPPGTDAQALVRTRRAFDTAWRALARNNFGALVLDDWQWVDPSSLALWDVEDSAAMDWPVARLVVHRSAALPRPALELRRRWLDTGLAESVHVGDFDDRELLTLVRTLAGTGSGERFAARLHQATGGNPLFVLETLRHLVSRSLVEADEDGRWHTPFDAVTQDYSELDVPATVRDTLLARVRALGPAVRHVLEVASLAGDAFTARLLAKGAGMDELATLQALEHAAAAHLVQGAERDAFRFSHDLVSEALADSLSAPRRATLHGQLADQLALQGEEPGRVALHLDAAGRQSEGAEWHWQAALSARQRRAWREALRQIDLCLQAAPAAERVVEAQLARAGLLHMLSDMPSVEAAHQAALAAASRLSPQRTLDVLIAQANHELVNNRPAQALQSLERMQSDPALQPAQRQQLALAQARALSQLGRSAQAVPLLQAALAAVPSSALTDRLTVLGTLAQAAGWSGDLALSVAVAEEAVALSRQLGDDLRAAPMLNNLAQIARDQGDRPRAAQLLQRAQDSARRARHFNQERVALYGQVVLHTDAGEADAALALIEQAEQMSPFWETPMLHNAFREARYYVHYLRGDEAAALDAAQSVIEHGRALVNPYGRSGALLLVFDLYLRTGRLQTAETLAREGLAAVQAASGPGARLAPWQVREAELLQAQGRPVLALERLTPVQAEWDTLREVERARLLATQAQAALDLGDAALAATALHRASSLGDVPVECAALCAAARLRWAQEHAGEELAAVRDAAQAMLAQPQLPRFEARLLQQALEAASR